MGTSHRPLPQGHRPGRAGFLGLFVCLIAGCLALQAALTPLGRAQAAAIATALGVICEPGVGRGGSDQHLPGHHDGMECCLTGQRCTMEGPGAVPHHDVAQPAPAPRRILPVRLTTAHVPDQTPVPQRTARGPPAHRA